MPPDEPQLCGNVNAGAKPTALAGKDRGPAGNMAPSPPGERAVPVMKKR